MLRLFSASQLFALFMLPVVAILALLPLVLWGGITPAAAWYPMQPLAEGLMKTGASAFVSGLVLVLGGALLTNSVFNRHEFHANSTRLPGFVFLLSACTFLVSYHEILPLLALIPLLPGISKVVGVYRQTHASKDYFEAGFWFGLSALIYPPFIALYPALVIATGYTRAFQWREYVLPAIGFTLPFVYWIAWLIWTDRTDHLVLFHSVVGRAFSFQLAFHGWSRNSMLIGTALCLLLAFPRFLRGFDRPNNKSKNVKVVFALMSLGVLVAPFVDASLTGNIAYSPMIIPVSFIAGYWFVNYRFSLIAPFVFYAWLVAMGIAVVRTGYGTAGHHHAQEAVGSTFTENSTRT